MRKVFVGVGLTAWLWLCTAVVAVAADGEGNKLGQNAGHLMSTWAKALFGGGAALIALAFLLNRKFADLAVFLVAALVVGGFVFAPDQVSGVITGIWDQLTA